MALPSIQCSSPRMVLPGGANFTENTCSPKKIFYATDTPLLLNLFMTIKEFSQKTEGLVDQLATMASYTQDKQQVQLLREALFGEAFEILSNKLSEKVAYRFADRALSDARKELKERQKMAVAAAVTKMPVTEN